MKVRVRATSKYQETNISDSELSVNGRVVPEEGKEWTTEKERAEMLEEKGFVTVIEEVKEVQKENKEVVEEKPKTTRKRTTTKK